MEQGDQPLALRGRQGLNRCQELVCQFLVAHSAVKVLDEFEWGRSYQPASFSFFESPLGCTAIAAYLHSAPALVIVFPSGNNIGETSLGDVRWDASIAVSYWYVRPS